MTIPMWTDDPVHDAEAWEQYKEKLVVRHRHHLPNELEDEESEEEEDADDTV